MTFLKKRSSGFIGRLWSCGVWEWVGWHQGVRCFISAVWPHYSSSTSQTHLNKTTHSRQPQQMRGRATFLCFLCITSCAVIHVSLPTMSSACADGAGELLLCGQPRFGQHALFSYGEMNKLFQHVLLWTKVAKLMQMHKNVIASILGFFTSMIFG